MGLGLFSSVISLLVLRRLGCVFIAFAHGGDHAEPTGPCSGRPYYGEIIEKIRKKGWLCGEMGVCDWVCGPKGEEWEDVGRGCLREEG